MHRSRFSTWTAHVGAVVVAVTAALLVGCASGPLPAARDLQAQDLARLRGSWVWSAWDTPARLGSGPIKVRLANGRLLFETAAATGSLALHEDATRRVLRGEGREKGTGQPFAVELTQRIGPGMAGTAEASVEPQFALIVVD